MDVYSVVLGEMEAQEFSSCENFGSWAIFIAWLWLF